MMPSELSAIREPRLKSAALIASVLSQAGVAAAIWGLRAAVLYGGDLVPLVSIAWSLLLISFVFLFVSVEYS